jgi:preprotein translocase subunit SecG
MDTTMIVRIGAAVLFIVILVVLIQRRRTRVK